MKRFFSFTVLIFVSSLLIQAQTRLPKTQIDRLAVRIAAARDLSVFDRQKLIRASLQIVIEYSIGETEFEAGRFQSFKEAERWLKSRVTDGFPIRAYRKFRGCRKGLCLFDNITQISHNRLFPQKILYGFYRKGRPFIKAIYFLAG